MAGNMAKSPMEWPVINLTIALLGALLHSFGLCLLFALRKSRMRGTQRCYLTHLSLTELLFCLDFSLRSFIDMGNQFLLPRNSVGALIQAIFLQVTVCMMWYLIMFTFTIDRLFQTKWTFLYRARWSTRRANVLCISYWIVCITGGAATVAVAVYLKSGMVELHTKFMFTLFLALDFIFLATALSTYALLFAMYKKSLTSTSLRRHTVESGSEDANTVRSAFSIFRGSKFWVATLILATFTLFAVCPDIFLAIMLLSKPMSKGMSVLFNVAASFRLTCFVADAVIYIFLSPKVKDLIVKKLCNLDRSRASRVQRGPSYPRECVVDEKARTQYVQTLTTEM